MLPGNQKGLQSYTLENVKKRIPPGSGNRLADKTAKQAAKGLGVTSEALIKALILVELHKLPLDSPKYTEAQNQPAKAEGAIKTEKGWWELPSSKLLVLEELAPTLVSQTHQATHLGHDKLRRANLKIFLGSPPLFPMQDKSSELHCLLADQCCLSAQTETSGIQLKGTLPFEYLEVDFTEMKPHRHYCYLLVIVCTFSGWVEAFPTRTERASKVAWCLLREIVTRFGFLTCIG